MKLSYAQFYKFVKIFWVKRKVAQEHNWALLAPMWTYVQAEADPERSGDQWSLCSFASYEYVNFQKDTYRI